MTDLVIGKPVGEAMKIGDAFLALMQSKGQLEPDEDVLEDAVAFAGVSKYPARIKCALLGWMAWKDATAQAIAAARLTARRTNGGAGMTDGRQRPTAVPEATAEQVNAKTRTSSRRCATWSTPSSASTSSTSASSTACDLDGPDRATIDMTLTSAACPLTDVIEEQAARRSRTSWTTSDQLGVDAAVGPGEDHR